MNELIEKIYDQAIVLEDGGDYVSGELDPVKFARLIVAECARVANLTEDYDTGDYKSGRHWASFDIKNVD